MVILSIRALRGSYGQPQGTHLYPDPTDAAVGVLCWCHGVFTAKAVRAPQEATKKSGQKAEDHKHELGRPCVRC